MWRQTGAVFTKEWRDAVRDRRSLVSALTYSLAGPLLVGGILLAMARAADSDRPLTVAVAGGERAASLLAFLEQRQVRVVPAPADARRALREGEIEAAIVIAEDYATRFAELRPAEARIAYDASRASARRVVPRVRALLEEYAAEEVTVRLVLRGVSPAVARPLRIRDLDVSSAASRAAMAMAALPIFLLLAPFISSMNLAIDVTAGERERNSLEPLLAHPVRRGALVLGKWLPAVVLSIAGAGLTLLVTQAVLRSRWLQALDAPIGITWTDSGALLAVLLPLALLAPAAQMLVAMFSRSYKEAQTWLSLLLFVPMVPGFLFAFGATRPAAWMAGTPVVGQHVLLERVMRGEPLEPAAWAVLAATTGLAGFAAVALTARLLGDERIVLGQ